MFGVGEGGDVLENGSFRSNAVSGIERDTAGRARFRVGISDALFSMDSCYSFLAQKKKSLPRERPMCILRARQGNRLCGGKKPPRNRIKPGKFF